ncbi:MAG TPA: PSD1 and planctomycete cytochrome C domain-containing protein [Chthonomonadaceae bacterium]|nr:PSD1 and planctomycete cytochrome C domain-containing protein [Chthonomonadaceae bacterium]
MSVIRLRRVVTWLAVCVLIGATALWPAPGTGQTNGGDATHFFETKVRPLLAEKCYGCHGDTLQRGGVRLDSREALLKDASALPITTPGDPEKSALIQAVRYTGKIKMPPAGKLSDAEIADLTQWVKAGAVWPSASANATPGPSFTDAQRKFWSFQPIVKPAVPIVKNRSWVKSPIDAFVLAPLEAKGLKPAPPADKRTLIRRATYDLIGLPPTPAEIEAFLADQSPNAFAKVVDRLLASPHYGERWGRHWLDVVRYTDSMDERGLGGEGDVSEAWRYRDWVVNALNADMPYDRFIMNQIAGDLMPTEPLDAHGKLQWASRKQNDLNISGTIATGMLAIGNWGNGDADKEKLVTDIADDQVDVISRAFMGLTVACARCHDHKFDPILTKDYYGLAGIFFSSHILPKLTPKGSGETPLRITLDTPELKATRDRFVEQVKEKEKQVQVVREAQYAAFVKTMLPKTATYLTAVWDYAHRPDSEAALSVADYASRHGLQGYALRNWIDTLGNASYRPMTMLIRDMSGFKGVHAWRGAPDCPNLVINTTNQAQHILTYTLPPRSVSVHPGPTNGVAVEWVSPIRGTVQIRGKVADADPTCGDGIIWALDHQTPYGVNELAYSELPNSGAEVFAQAKTLTNLAEVPVAPGDKLQLVVLPNANYFCDMTTVQITINETDGTRVWNLAADLVDSPFAGNPHPDRYGNPDVWRFSDMADYKRGVRAGGAFASALTTWRQTALKAKDRADVERASQTCAQTFMQVDSHNAFWPTPSEEMKILPSSARQSITQAQSDLAALRRREPPPIILCNGIQEGGIPECPQAGIHDVCVHIRGRYDRLGDLVPRHFPLILAGNDQPPITQGSGRLQLAQWLASGTHPLTARVMVNRIWQHHFGEGIVRTPGNFGFLGERPTNPALLDWLAATFLSPPARAQQAAPPLERQKHREKPENNPQINADYRRLNAAQEKGAVFSYGCGWSLKQMHRLIMLSNAYQQASEGDPQTMKADPDNRLFGHMNRLRLEAEPIRDTLLAVSGKLDATMGGVAIRDLNTHRRTLYVMTVRSDRSGYAPLFDTADPTAIVDKRVVSTVAPQALFLMNHPLVIAQTKALTQRVITEGGTTDMTRIQWLYPLLYGRPVSADELKIGQTFLARTRQSQKTSGANQKNDLELRTWEAYCQVLLCANELIYVD